MIISRTPMRISLGGGGTDLPSYFERFGGALIAGAIDKYVFVGINRTFTDDYFLKYSALERVTSIDEIQHAIIREVLKRHSIAPSIEVVSLADIPAGTGLGSSGSFTVGLLRAVYALKRRHVTAGALAAEACEIEIDVLQRSVGKQDQYIAGFGGLTYFEFERCGQVHASPLQITNDTFIELEEHLLMFFTGYSRDADLVLEEQKTLTDQDDVAMLDNLHYVKELGLLSKKALERGDTIEFGRLMHEHWDHKKKRSTSMSNDRIDRWYEIGLTSGALGGKLVGAGAGGFLLFYAKDQDAVRLAMADERLPEIRFSFDHEGSSLIVRD